MKRYEEKKKEIEGLAGSLENNCNKTDTALYVLAKGVLIIAECLNENINVEVRSGNNYSCE